MARSRGRQSQSEEQGGGQDSFVDIVSNLVGILIILVMMTFARIQSFSSTEPVVDEALTARARAVELEQAKAEQLYRDVMTLDQQKKDIASERKYREAERIRLAATIQMVEHDIDEFQAGLDDSSRVEFELSRRIAETESRLDHAKAAIHQVVPQAVEQEVLINYPTPISQTVNDQEVHFRILEGRVTQVPIKLLVERAKGDLRNHLYELRRTNRAEGMVGPIGDFRMRYQAAAIQGVDPASGMSGTRVVLAHADFLPTGQGQGEPIKSAMQLNSEFMRTLAGYHPSTAAITIWVYPDSFAEFREVRQKLYSMGYVVAARPLEGTIAGGINGSKSSAQ